MAITRAQAKRGTKVHIPTRKTYYPDDDVTTSWVCLIAKDLGRDYLIIECYEEPVAPLPERVTLVLKLNDTGSYFTLNDLNLY